MLIFNKIKEIRSLLDLTQSELQIATGLSQRDISQLENGEKKFIPTPYIQFLNKKKISLSLLYDDSVDVREFINYHTKMLNNVGVDVGVDVVNDTKKEEKTLQYHISDNESIKRLNDIYKNEERLNAEMSLYKLHTDYFGTERQSIPLYEIDAAAGLATLFSPQIQQIPIDHITVPNAPKCDGAVYIRGDSMYPILKSGDIACYKTINDLDNIYYGDMHLLDYEVEGDQHLTVKYVQKSERGSEYVRLVSHNDHYAPKDIHISSIRAIALIKLSIRYNTLA